MTVRANRYRKTVHRYTHTKTGQRGCPSPGPLRLNGQCVYFTISGTKVWKLPTVMLLFVVLVSTTPVGVVAEDVLLQVFGSSSEPVTTKVMVPYGYGYFFREWPPCLAATQ